MGLVAFGLALVLGQIAGVGTSTIQSGFPTKLFVTLLGVMLLFSIAQENKTMEQLARRIIGLAGKRIALIPIIVYVFSAILAAVGPGTVPVMGLMAVFTCSLAAEMRISPLLLSATSVLGAAAGGLTPIAPTGILGLSLAEEQGITGIAFPYAMNMVMAMTVYFIVIYIVLKGYKLRSNVDVAAMEKTPFDSKQWITLAGITVLVVAVVGLGFDVGLTSFTVAMILLLVNAGDQKKSIAGIPWSTPFRMMFSRPESSLANPAPRASIMLIRPRVFTVPRSGFMTLPMRLSSVVFPQPFAPAMPSVSPAGTWREKSLNTCLVRGEVRSLIYLGRCSTIPLIPVVWRNSVKLLSRC